MLRLHLVRHAAFDSVGSTIVGRTGSIALNDEGRAQADRLARALAAEPVAAVYTSPLDRARETAVSIAAVHGVTPIESDAFAELDFGEWTGSNIRDLDAHRAWHDFNTLRSLTRIPGGELMLEVQTRAVTGLLDIQRRYDGRTVAIVSHADVIRAVIGHLLGIPMDHLLRLEIQPATYTTVQLHGAWPQVLCIGRSADQP